MKRHSTPDYKYDLLRDELVTPMRDGTKLRADLYLPKGSGPWPTLLERTPYNKESSVEVATVKSPDYYARRGYAVVIQDVRGRYASEGEFRPFRPDGWGRQQDGFDTIERLARQTWCNGRIGMIGGSYAGHTQYGAAGAAPPHLTAIFARQAPANYHSGMFFPGGAFELGTFLHWATSQVRLDLKRYLSGTDLERRNKELEDALSDIDRWYSFLPVAEMPLLKGLAGWYYEWLEQPADGPWWQEVSPETRYRAIDVPACHLGGWFDTFQQSTIDLFNGFSRGAKSARIREGQRLIMGPWHHGPPPMGCSVVGEFDFGPEARFDFNGARLPWFDYWLKGVDSGVMAEPPVRYFTMGINQWRTAPHWPPANSDFVRFYFRAGPAGSADSLNDGLLSKEEPAGTSEADNYVYDPKDPIPTHGGALIYPGKPPAGPFDQRVVERRCLTYSSEPLTQPLEVTGPVTAVLFASSSARDTDWVVRVCDVDPGGRSRPLCEGIVRARYRRSLAEPELLVPGESYCFRVPLGSTSNVFLAGHRIRVSVTSSSFPRWDRNLNTGGQFAREAEGIVATNTILRDRFNPSHVELPVVSAV
ncbi:MAG: CocE/NonD family hydrolase [Chloroflexi bacterium]|nr:CocE/NonD family hydrolase [Chloroflexota bacterium]